MSDRIGFDPDCLFFYFARFKKYDKIFKMKNKKITIFQPFLIE